MCVKNVHGVGISGDFQAKETVYSGVPKAKET